MLKGGKNTKSNLFPQIHDLSSSTKQNNFRIKDNLNYDLFLEIFFIWSQTQSKKSNALSIYSKNLKDPPSLYYIYIILHQTSKTCIYCSLNHNMKINNFWDQILQLFIVNKLYTIKIKCLLKKLNILFVYLLVIWLLENSEHVTILLNHYNIKLKSQGVLQKNNLLCKRGSADKKLWGSLVYALVKCFLFYLKIMWSLKKI